MKIRFLTGPNKDQQFSIKKGIILSRTAESGDIVVKDSLASSPHAQIIKKGKAYYFKDLGSKNGTYLNKEVNNYFPLKPGLQFQIGNTLFQVIDTTSSRKESWPSVITKALKRYQPKIKNLYKRLTLIQPPLVLQFKSGIQKSDSWTVYYGPRQAGRASIDLPILDPLAPDICFSLYPQESAVLFKTACPEKVLVNNKYSSEKTLQPKDRISFCSTCIEVDYLKEDP